jgi:hypothetical protein
MGKPLWPRLAGHGQAIVAEVGRPWASHCGLSWPAMCVPMWPMLAGHGRASLGHGRASLGHGRASLGHGQATVPENVPNDRPTCKFDRTSSDLGLMCKDPKIKSVETRHDPTSKLKQCELAYSVAFQSETSNFVTFR